MRLNRLFPTPSQVILPALLGTTSALVFALPAAANQLVSWRFDPTGNRLVFITTAGVQPRAQLLFNPTRVVIDLPNTTLSSGPSTQTFPGPIRAVRTGQFDSATARLVIELAPDFTLDPRQVSVQGLQPTEWLVQLPTPQRIAAPSGTGSSVAVTVEGNGVSGRPVTGAATQLDSVLATPDGFLLRTRGPSPEVQIERVNRAGQPRQIVITLPNTSISPLLRAERLPTNRYSVARWEVIQSTEGVPTAQIVMTLAPQSPDWQVVRDLPGGVVLLPPPGVSLATIPDQFPQAQGPLPVQPPPPGATSPPPQPVPPFNPGPPAIGRPVVVIDPGHGGRDPGAIGIGGLQEKVVVMEVSLRVAELLRAQGVEVILTRADDRTVELQPRVDIANRTNATVFVSIHANALSMSRPDVNGIETFFFTESGRRLAEIIHGTIQPVSGLRDRGVKRANFFVLRNTRMPAALLEIGFLTGQEDIRALADPAWRERMAQGIAVGILRYLQGG